MDKSPFSIYDFLGYAIPGVLTLYLLAHFEVLFVSDVVAKIFANKNWSSISYVVGFIICSYIVGHLVSYISSITVEKFAVWCYGYPSSYLKERQSFFRYFRSNSFSKYNCISLYIKYIVRLLLGLYLLPLFVAYLMVEVVSLITGFSVVKPMLKAHWECLVLQWNKFVKKNDLDTVCQNKPEDNYRFIFNYVYESTQISSKKLDNYVALYGFTRSIALILNSFFIYELVVRGFDFTSLFSVLGVLGFSSVMFFYAFLKFYRRYTLEGFMGFIIAITKEEK